MGNAVKLDLQVFLYQASYKPTSPEPHVVVAELQSGLGWEHTQLWVCSMQTFSLSKQLRAQLGISERLTGGLPGHCVSYQSSVRFQQSQFTVHAHIRGFGLLQKQSTVIPCPQSSSELNSGEQTVHEHWGIEVKLTFASLRWNLPPAPELNGDISAMKHRMPVANLN